MERRSLLRLASGLTFTTAIGAASPALADGTGAATAVNSPFGVRGLGNPNAPIKVYEYFSMNCPHCAYFATHALPRIISAFVKPGKIYYVFKDFPLNEDALMAAQIARTLPAHEYFPFITELFRTQDQWAYDPSLKTKTDYANALFRYAALAGMDQAQFDAALGNAKLRKFIMGELNTGEKQYNINATPTFIINGRKHEGAVDFEQFSNWLKAA